MTTSPRGAEVALVLGQLIETDTRLRPGGLELATARHRWWLTIELGRLFQHVAELGAADEQDLQKENIWSSWAGLWNGSEPVESYSDPLQ